MNFKEDFFHCSRLLLKSVPEIEEIRSIVHAVDWQKDMVYEINGKEFEHQTGYNKQFETGFSDLNGNYNRDCLTIPG